ncbi:MAG: nucleotidyl transferase AbiEii/AbiGii toxin family protein [Acidobacteria bacterium]|nr:nucleotidyl transferase AbiEii/AbiGii toxin family protein [Acidobacteriota bacterium]
MAKKTGTSQPRDHNKGLTLTPSLGLWSAKSSSAFPGRWPCGHSPVYKGPIYCDPVLPAHYSRLPLFCLLPGDQYLQHVLLRQLFERDLLGNIVFHGGTALRIVHDLPRFSEDLDFHLTRPDPKYNLGAAMDDVGKDLERAGYQVSLSPHLQGAVQSCMLSFKRLLYECGLSPHERQKLKVKLEIDCNTRKKEADDLASAIEAILPETTEQVFRHYIRK